MEWADKMKELIKIAVDLEDLIEVIQKLRKEYRDYLTVRVRVKKKPEKGSSTPFSAPPKIVRVETNKQSANNEVSQQVRHIIYYLHERMFFISCLRFSFI